MGHVYVEVACDDDVGMLVLHALSTAFFDQFKVVLSAGRGWGFYKTHQSVPFWNFT